MLIRSLFNNEHEQHVFKTFKFKLLSLKVNKDICDRKTVFLDFHYELNDHQRGTEILLLRVLLQYI